MVKNKFYKGFPLYNAEIKDINQGILFISLVDEPATEQDWVLFKKEEMQVRFALESEEKHLISGVIMLPDVPLLQKTDEGKYYYVSYSKEVIRKMSEKMLVDGTYRNIDLMHNMEVIGGVNLVELYIKDSEKGIVPSFLGDIPDGTLVGTFHIENEALWEEIKKGDFLKGFSLAGRFAISREKTEDNKFFNIFKKMKKITKMFVKFASVQTDKGVLNYAGEDEIKVGDEVFIETEEGEAVPAEDGEYIYEEKTIIVKDGKVEEIKEKEEEKVEEPVEEPVEEEETEEPVAEPTPEPEVDEVAQMKEDIAALKAEIEALKEAIAKIVEQPQSEPIEEEFDKVKHSKIDENLPKSTRNAIKLFSNRM